MLLMIALTVVVSFQTVGTLLVFGMLLAQRVVVYGPGNSVLTPETLLATFGIIARLENRQVIVVEKEHGCEHCP